MPDRDRAAILAACDDAVRRGLGRVACYRAAVDAWVHRYPAYSRQYGAQLAVGVVLGERVVEDGLL